MKTIRFSKQFLKIMLLIVVVFLGITAVIAYDQREEIAIKIRQSRLDAATKAYNACVKAGGSVGESYPPTCIDKDGNAFRPTLAKDGSYFDTSAD